MPSHAARQWAAEVALRSLGLILLAMAGTGLPALRRGLSGPFPHPAGPIAFLLAALIFAAIVTGLALLIEGPGLLRSVPYPRRRLI